MLCIVQSASGWPVYGGLPSTAIESEVYNAPRVLTAEMRWFAWRRLSVRAAKRCLVSVGHIEGIKTLVLKDAWRLDASAQHIMGRVDPWRVRSVR